MKAPLVLCANRGFLFAPCASAAAPARSVDQLTDLQYDPSVFRFRRSLRQDVRPMSLLTSGCPEFDRLIRSRHHLQQGDPTCILPLSDESDLFIDEVCQALRSTGYPALRGILVEVDAGQILLRGNVPSYFLKQQAQTVAREIGRRHRIQNEIEVSPASIRLRPMEGDSETRTSTIRGHG
jgi:hypothetical protein